MRRNYERLMQEKFGDPIGSYAGDAPVGVRSMPEDDVLVCPSCGMMPIDGVCGCGQEDCGCGMPAEKCDCGDHMHEGVEPCAECGMYEIEGSCGCTHEAEIKEVAPPGKEKMVKALKKRKDIDNPWAVAWAAHNKKEGK